MAESISEGTLRTWQKKVGDTVAVDEEIATIETDKVGTIPQTVPVTFVLFLLPSISAPIFRNLISFVLSSLTFLMSVPFIGKAESTSLTIDPSVHHYHPHRSTWPSMRPQRERSPSCL